MKKTILLLLALPFFLLSCKDALDDVKSIGTFTSTITGDVEKQFDGTAAFVHTITSSGTDQGSLLPIALSKVTDQSEAIGLGLANFLADGVKEGTYNFGNTELIFLPTYVVDQANYSVPDPTKTNQVIITSLTDVRVKGSFEVNLIELTTQKSVKIVGTFDALGTTETK